jgi:hypothetical protein
MTTDDRDLLSCCDSCGKEILDGDQFTVGDEGLHWCLACLNDCQEYALRMWQESVDEAIAAHDDRLADREIIGHHDDCNFYWDDQGRLSCQDTDLDREPW